MSNLITLFFIIHFAIYTIADNSTNQELDVNNQQCPNGWSTRADKDGNVYGYQVIMQDMINYYQVKIGIMKILEIYFVIMRQFC